MTKIKICGLTRPEDVAAVNELRPDYIGFVFAKKSRRCVSLETAAALRAQLDAAIPAVGVFVNEEAEAVARLLNNGIIQVAQLHGSEDEAYIHRLRALTSQPLWRAFKVAGPEDLSPAAALSADLILLDNGPGGTGERFDWSLLQDFDARPYLLAGGLGPGNVREAIRTLRPYGVDVSSGVETAGRKDPAKMREFIQAVREADT